MIHRSESHRPFTRRDCRLYGLVLRAARSGLPDPVAAAAGPDPAAAAERAGVRLTPRQLDVLGGLLRGEGTKQTAWRLGLSPKTVAEHLGRLYARFGVDGRATLLAMLTVDAGVATPAPPAGGVRYDLLADPAGADRPLR